MDLLDLFLVFSAGVGLGYWWSILRVYHRLASDPQRLVRLGEELQKLHDDAESENEPRKIRIEKHGSELYLFTEDTDEFLAQGMTLEDALDRVNKRFPGQLFKGHITKEDAERLGITVKQI